MLVGVRIRLTFDDTPTPSRGRGTQRTGKRVTAVEWHPARLDGSVLGVSDGGVGRLVAAAGRTRYDPQGIVDGVGTKSVYAVD